MTSSVSSAPANTCSTRSCPCPLDLVAEALDVEFDEDQEEEADTLGGLVFANLSVIPEDGSRPVVEAMGLRIRVEELCERRVEWALVEKLEAVAATSE